MAAAATAPSRHEPFRFRTAAGMLRKAAALGVDLPFDDDIDSLLEPAAIAGRKVPNRLAVQPLEGADAAPDGAPGELTLRRYRRYAEGGSGLIWCEAAAVTPGGRANLHQLMITRANVAAFRSLAGTTRAAARAAFGKAHRPFLVLQLTHAGRYSRAEPGSVPRGVAVNPHLDARETPAAPWSDEELDAIRVAFIEAVRLAAQAGFDAVDIKACHGYLLSELLGARTRAGSRYGGPFENRTRLLLDIVAGARAAVADIGIAVRLNVTDLVPFPFGFGMAADDSGRIDPAEPLALARALVASGCSLLNASAGVPRYATHVGRPFDRPAAGDRIPDEHPLEGVGRLIRLAAEVQLVVAPVPVVGSGYSWLRQFWPHVGAAVVRRGLATFIGLGRSALAYPDAPKDLMRHGSLDRSKCCTACSRCVELLRHGGPTGCVVRDRPLFARLHREMTQGKGAR